MAEVDADGRLVLHPGYPNLLAQFDRLVRDGREAEAMVAAATLADWSYLTNQLVDWLRVATWRLAAVQRTGGDMLVPLVDLGLAEAFADVRDLAVTHLEEALTLARRRHDHHRTARALLGLGVVRKREERLDEAVSLNVAALDAAQLDEVVDADLVRLILNNLGVVHRERGHPDEALACYEQAEEMAARSGDRQGVAMAVINQCQANLDLERWAEASALARRARVLAAEPGYVEIELSACLNGALADMELSDFAAATEELTRHRVLSAAWGSPLDLAKNVHNHGWMAHLQGDDERARTLLEEAIRAKEPIGNRVSTAAAHRDLGHVQAALGDVDAALIELEAARRLFAEASSDRAAEVVADMAALRSGSSIGG